MDLRIERYWKLLDESTASHVLGSGSVPRSSISVRAQSKSKVASRSRALEVLPWVVSLRELGSQGVRRSIPEWDDDAFLLVQVEASPQGDELEDCLQQPLATQEIADDDADVVGECPDIDIA